MDRSERAPPSETAVIGINPRKGDIAAGGRSASSNDCEAFLFSSEKEGGGTAAHPGGTPISSLPFTGSGELETRRATRRGASFLPTGQTIRPGSTKTSTSGTARREWR